MSRPTSRVLLLCVLLGTLCAAQLAPAPAADDSAGQAAGTPPSPEPSPAAGVTVHAPQWDPKTLEQVIVPRFVRSHSVPTATAGQIARWRQPICPNARGLKPDFGRRLEQRVLATAQRIGAQTFAAGQKCPVNIEIVFTPAPQALVDDIQAHYSYLLGSGRKAGDTRFTRPIQSWYVTGTRSTYGFQPPVTGFNAPGGSEQAADRLPSEFPPNGGAPNLVPDAPYTTTGAPSGQAGSHLGADLHSELLHVLVIVDAQQVSRVSLDALADYISLIGLTRMTHLDTCNELPSIIDLLLPSTCGGRPHPAALTAADSAFLQALYASTLDKKLNIEEGELRDRMLAILNQHP